MLEAIKEPNQRAEGVVVSFDAAVIRAVMTGVIYGAGWEIWAKTLVSVT